MIGIDKKQLEANLFARLEDEDEWEALLERTYGDWDFDPDADYDEGHWMDLSRWRWTGDYLGYRVRITATPESGKYDRFEEVPPIGDLRSVEVLESPSGLTTTEGWGGSRPVGV